MREYGIVSPRFWIGETGKLLRGDAEAQVLALYLMTCPHSHMTGVFHCPVLYMAHETGLTVEGASKALRRLIEVAFCEYDEASETVFVVRMAAYQIGETLKEGDKRIVGLRRDVENMAKGRMKSRFLEVYGEAFRLVKPSEKTSSSEAPSKPHRSQEQEQEQEQVNPLPSVGGEGGSDDVTGSDEHDASPSAPPLPDEPGRAVRKPKPERGSRLPDDWRLPRAWGEWALTEQPTWNADHVRKVAESFRDFWIAKPGREACKLDWEATWRVWVRKEAPLRNGANGAARVVGDDIFAGCE